jgi:tetratricopeptide (TPR) repeat protein
MSDVPALVTAAHTLLAECALDQQRYRAARQHLRAALALTPQDADLHYRYALALDADWNVQPCRAWRAIRRALRLRPDEPRSLALAGQIALRMRRPRTALRAFRRACACATIPADALNDVLDGLCVLNCRDEAFARLTLARFEAPHDAGIKRVWDEFHLRELVPTTDTPDVLPFPRAAACATAAPVRYDRCSPMRTHVLRLPFGRLRSRS